MGKRGQAHGTHRPGLAFIAPARSYGQMIKYSLKCDRDHAFESWFASAEAYDTLAKAGQLTCAVCGSAEVSKAIMAPRVRTEKAAQPSEAPVPEPPRTPAEAEAMLRAYRAHVEKHSDYVGNDFAREARAIHEGEAPERAIYGEAKPKDAKALIEDGIPVAPLPVLPSRKTN